VSPVLISCKAHLPPLLHPLTDVNGHRNLCSPRPKINNHGQVRGRQTSRHSPMGSLSWRIEERRVADVLVPAIGVVHEPLPGLAVARSHLEGVQGEVCPERGRSAPHDELTVRVDDEGQVDENPPTSTRT